MKRDRQRDTRMLLAVLVGLLLAQLPASAFYNPVTGRWLSRDPIGENGGCNQYGFVANAALAAYDVFGQERAPNEDWFSSKNQTATIKVTVTVDGFELCNRGHIDFGVNFNYVGEKDARYAERALFVFGGNGVAPVFSYDREKGEANVCGSYSLALSSACPAGKQTGSMTFDALYNDDAPPALNYVWGVSIAWEYTRNPCCELEWHLAATFACLCGPYTMPIPPPLPKVVRCGPQALVHDPQGFDSLGRGT
jgi:hypothetical protein